MFIFSFFDFFIYTAYIIRKSEVIKLKGDHMPVGRYLVEKEHFQSMTTTIEKGDMVYTLSDGIQDQPGGDECITAWRGSRPQVDDMTMIGIRV